MVLYQRNICSALILALVALGVIYFDVTLATMSQDTCGEIIYVNKTEAKRAIVSKAFTHNTKFKNCSWEIVAPSQYVIVLNFSYIDLNDHENCVTENVTIESKLGSNDFYHRHGVFCGSTPPLNIVSIGSTLKIMFSFASSTSGFAADYNLDLNECAEFNGGCHQKCYNRIGGRECGCQKGFTLHPNMHDCRKDTCGGLIYSKTQSSGLIISPSFPNIYPNYQKCEWEIVSPPLHKIMLNFTYFNIEDGHNCNKDNITVYSRLGVDDFQKHGSYCGSSKPPIIVSDGNVMRIEFSSDDSNSRPGFAARYHVIADECAEANGGCQHNCVNTLAGHECSCRPGFALTNDKHGCNEVCGGLFFDFNGTISSPLFPENYLSNLNCQWNIVAPQGYRIRLEFYYFDLEDTKHCSADNLKLYSRKSVDINKMLGVFCGLELPPVIVSDTTNLIIQFESDSLFSGAGFTATYSFVDVNECAINGGSPLNGQTFSNSECTSNITTGSGTFTSVNYPNSYPPNQNCTWRINLKAGHRVQLTIVDFDVEVHQSCIYDYLSIYDGDISNDTLKGKYCGTNESTALALPILALGNIMVVEFRSDTNVQRKGFNATFTSVCGGDLTATTVAKDLYSHGGYGSEDYGPNILCNWIITAPSGRTIKFHVTDIQLEGNCVYDYLQITEKMHSVTINHGKYCDSGRVLEITSQSNSLEIQFKTDGSNGYRGFAANYYFT